MIYWQRGALSELLQQAEQTKKILEGNDLILAALVDQQGSLRAFIITGDAPRLDRYKVAEGDYKVQLEKIKEFNANEPEQLKRLDELNAQSKSWDRRNGRACDRNDGSAGRFEACW